MKNEKLSKLDLKQFSGTENWYRHGLMRHILYTDGIQYMAKTAGAYWLIDEIALSQLTPAISRQEFQRWILEVKLEESTAFLSCDDGNDRIVYSKKIEYTDFPLDEIKIYFTNNVMMLPSEY